VSNFIFNWAAAALAVATLNLSTGNYYAHLVTTIPVVSDSTVADLVIPSISGYVPTPLTGLSYNTTRWTFDSFNFPNYAFVGAPKGVVICKRSGASPASTDGIICYSDFNNAIGQLILLSPGTYVVNLQFTAAGAINFSYRNQYISGTYNNTEPIPKGLIYLIGTQNNNLAFSDPNPTKFKINQTFDGTLTNRIVGVNNSEFITTKSAAFDFITAQVKPGKIGILNEYAVSQPVTIKVRAANNIGDDFTNNWNNLSYYTQIGDLSIADWPSGWRLIPCLTTNFWRYIHIEISTNPSTIFNIQELEFYESAGLSVTPNFS
jgi:hypothetical protein